MRDPTVCYRNETSREVGVGDSIHLGMNIWDINVVHMMWFNFTFASNVIFVCVWVW